MPDQRAFKAMDEAGIDVQFLNFTYASTATLRAMLAGKPELFPAIQSAYNTFPPKEAEERVPSEFLRATSLLGDEGYVRERVQAYRDAGVTCLNIDIREFVEEPATLVEKLRSLVDA
jgi:hypothetical protein